MDERLAFIRAITDGWDDTLPVLVYADWAEERGVDQPALLRWYAWHVMPALAAVPSDARPANTATRDNARKTIRSHPQAEVLFLLAAVAFCRRPEVWESLTMDVAREAVSITRLFALGLATAEQRRASFRRLLGANRSRQPRLTELYQFPLHAPPPGTPNVQQRAEQLKRLEDELRQLHLGTLVADAAGPAVADAAMWGRSENYALARGYQTAVYLALANVPPLESGEEVTPEPAPPELAESRGERQPTKLPREFFRLITIDDRRYGWWLRCPSVSSGMAFLPESILVRLATNTGQRLVVRFGYPVWHFVGGQRTYPTPALVERMIRDALAGGWEPEADSRPDFEWDGRPYLPHADETTFG